MEAAVTEAVYSEDGAAFDDVTFTVGELFESYDHLCLKYYEVKFCCIHGGQAFKPKCKGRRNTS